MTKRLRPSPALVISIIALFVSIGGVGYAASKIGTNDIKNQAVTKPKIAKKAVETGRLDDQAVTERTIRDLAVTTGKLADGAVTTTKLGPSAVTTDKISDGQVRSPDLGPITEVSVNSATVANGDTAGQTASCPAGSTVISGGGDGGGNGSAWRIQRSIRFGNGWRVFGTNQTGGNSFLQAKAYCLQG